VDRVTRYPDCPEAQDLMKAADLIERLHREADGPWFLFGGDLWRGGYEHHERLIQQDAFVGTGDDAADSEVLAGLWPYGDDEQSSVFHGDPDRAEDPHIIAVLRPFAEVLPAVLRRCADTWALMHWQNGREGEAKTRVVPRDDEVALVRVARAVLAHEALLRPEDLTR
jgi:hypothetical protein